MKGKGLQPLRAAVGEWKPGRGITSDPLHAIASGWALIVGPGVAAASAPLEISGKTLVVATKSSAWSQQLHFLSEAILAGVRDVAAGAGIERLSFRAGALRRRAEGGERPRGAVRRKPVEKTPPDAEPAIDLQAAFERLRDRMRGGRPGAGTGCEACGAYRDMRGDGETPGVERRCAPCAGREAAERTTALERIIYMAPWLTLAELREQLPALSGTEFEHARRRLIQRWWLMLERARRAGTLSSSGLERHVASSYVLLQSRLPPDRISPAVVRNVLGEELDALLWPRGPQAPGVGHRDGFVE